MQLVWSGDADSREFPSLHPGLREKSLEKPAWRHSIRLMVCGPSYFAIETYINFLRSMRGAERDVTRALKQMRDS